MEKTKRSKILNMIKQYVNDLAQQKDLAELRSFNQDLIATAFAIDEYIVKDQSLSKEARMKKIGASEAPCLLQTTHKTGYQTLYELHRIKRGDEPKDLSGEQKIQMGLEVEQFVVYHIIKHIDPSLRFVRGLRHTKDVFTALPDFEIIAHSVYEGRGVLEVKTIDTYSEMWKENLKDFVIPLRYDIQMQVQMYCTGYTWGILATKIGAGKIIISLVARDEERIETIKKAAEIFIRNLSEERFDGFDYAILQDMQKYINSKEYNHSKSLTVQCSENRELTETFKNYKRAVKERNKLEKSLYQDKNNILRGISRLSDITPREIIFVDEVRGEKRMYLDRRHLKNGKTSIAIRLEKENDDE